MGDRESSAVLPSEYSYLSQRSFKPLDIVEVPLLRAEPRLHQTENHVIDAARRWKKAGQAQWSDLAEYVETPASLWPAGTQTKSGMNDCVEARDAVKLRSSLPLIVPQTFNVQVGMERGGGHFEKRSLRGKFRYRNVEYSLHITDPVTDAIFRQKPEGEYSLANVYLCVSLTEPFTDGRESMKLALKANSMQYVFLGKELGARSEDPACYENGKVQYGRLVQTELFQRGIGRIRDGMRKHRLALMCAEKEPLECHRGILIARHLEELGIKVQHIQSDGALETHAEGLKRLADSLNLAQGDLFNPVHDVFADAYRRQEERIAYDANVVPLPGLR